jgi:phosphatidylserine/phosphatidylglycerophosphate/cardiolipin synthase-like enzyme
VFRAVLIALLVVLLLLSGIPVVAAEEDIPQVQLTRVCPAYPGEFVTVTNSGGDLDMNGWRLSDGEGSVTFTSLRLPEGGSVTWTDGSGRFPALFPGEAFLNSSSGNVECQGSLKLADDGDQVFLFDGRGVLMDVLHYGSSEPLAPWSGPSVVCRKGMMLSRHSPEVGHQAWSAEVPGIFSVSTSWYRAEVVPVLYPENGLEVLTNEIDRSRESVDLCTYIMENWTLARHLASASLRGVNVTVLLEGQPVGGVSQNGAAIAYYLRDAGAEVWIMRSSSSFRRYDYLHAKYAVFDGERVMVCSENMADSSFSSNRGWGAVAHSRQLSSVAAGLFERDLAGKGVDVFPLELSLPQAQGGPGHLVPHPSSMDVQQADIALFSSPHQYREMLVTLLDSAQRRVLIQQMRIQEDWLEGEVLSSLFRAAERGVQVQVMLDSGLGTKEENRRTASSLNQRAASNSWDLECRLMNESLSIERLHNKGVVVDDTVLVGSANWVDNSMEENRELMMAIRSEGTASTYSSWFQDDWVGDALPPAIALPWHHLNVREGEPIVLDATGCHDPSGISGFHWDLDGDGVPDVQGPLQVVSLPRGTHRIGLKVTDILGNSATEVVYVTVSPGGNGAGAWMLYAPLPAAMLLLFIRSRHRRI